MVSRCVPSSPRMLAPIDSVVCRAEHGEQVREKNISINEFIGRLSYDCLSSHQTKDKIHTPSTHTHTHTHTHKHTHTHTHTRLSGYTMGISQAIRCALQTFCILYHQSTSVLKVREYGMEMWVNRGDWTRKQSKEKGMNSFICIWKEKREREGGRGGGKTERESGHMKRWYKE